MSANLVAGPGYYTGITGHLSDLMENLANLRHSGYLVASPGASTIPTPRSSVALTEVGTHTARPMATTNRFTQAGRVGYELAATTLDTFTEIYQATLPQTVRSQLMMAAFRFGISDAAAVAGAKGFWGLNASGSAMDTTEINAIANVFGFGQLSTSNNLCLCFAGAGGVGTTYDLSSLFPANTLSKDYYTAQLSWQMDGIGPISWSIVNECTGSKASGFETTNLPALNTYLYWHFFRTNGATTALKAAFDFGGLDVFSPY